MHLKYFEIINKPTQELLALLENNVIGSTSGMLYQHKQTESKLFNISKPFFLNLKKQDRILGTACFSRRETFNAGMQKVCYYIRYFSFSSVYRNKKENQQSSNRKGQIREELSEIIIKNLFIENPDSKFFQYAYLDPGNTRSKKLCNEFGFEQIRSFQTILFHRLKPGIKSNVVKAGENEFPVIKEALTDFYQEHTMLSYENFHAENYYLLKDESGNIIAGVQAVPDNWRIHALPGITGKLILNMFPKLPILKTIVNKDYHFLTMEGLFYKPGSEHQLAAFFETILAIKGKNIAMLWADTDSELFRILKKLPLGIIDKLNKPVNAEVVCRFVNFSEEEKKDFRRHPVYISGTDLT
jgi:hypothetical protein